MSVTCEHLPGSVGRGSRTLGIAPADRIRAAPRPAGHLARITRCLEGFVRKAFLPGAKPRSNRAQHKEANTT